ncbi:Multiple C2 and transmembrane domain-containing protein 1 [Balamuthia mandrillaris]
MGTLTVEVLRGNDLAAKDRGGTSDPYCKFGLVPLAYQGDALKKKKGKNKKKSKGGSSSAAGNQEHRTQVIDKDLNPVWNHPPVSFNTLNDGPWVGLKLEVYDKDILTDDFMGEVFLSAEEIESWDLQPRFERSFEVQPRKKPEGTNKKKKEDEVSGTITLALHFEFQRNQQEKSVLKLCSKAGLEEVLEVGTPDASPDFKLLVNICKSDAENYGKLLDSGLLDRLNDFVDRLAKSDNTLKVLCGLELLRAVFANRCPRGSKMEPGLKRAKAWMSTSDLLQRVMAFTGRDDVDSKQDTWATGGTSSTIKQAVAKFVAWSSIFPEQDLLPTLKIFDHPEVISTLYERIAQYGEAEPEIANEYVEPFVYMSWFDRMAGKEEWDIAWAWLEENKVVENFIPFTQKFPALYTNKYSWVSNTLRNIAKYTTEHVPDSPHIATITDQFNRDLEAGHFTVKRLTTDVPKLTNELANSVLSKFDERINGETGFENEAQFGKMLESVCDLYADVPNYRGKLAEWERQNLPKVMAYLVEHGDSKDAVTAGARWLVRLTPDESFRAPLWEAKISTFYNAALKLLKDAKWTLFRHRIPEHFHSFEPSGDLEALQSLRHPDFPVNKLWVGPGKGYFLLNEGEEPDGSMKTIFSYAGKVTKTLNTFSTFSCVLFSFVIVISSPLLSSPLLSSPLPSPPLLFSALLCSALLCSALLCSPLLSSPLPLETWVAHPSSFLIHFT